MESSSPELQRPVEELQCLQILELALTDEIQAQYGFVLQRIHLFSYASDRSFSLSLCEPISKWATPMTNQSAAQITMSSNNGRLGRLEGPTTLHSWWK